MDLPTNAPTLDLTVLDDVRALLGADRVGELLGDLADELAERFEPASDDAAKLAFDAHAMVAAAGALGFAEMSSLCREVEQACRSGRDIHPFRKRIEDACATVCREIGGLRAA